MLARLRDVFLPNRDPQRAYFCTYGLDPKFFEGELLPALFPNSLALDREAGTASAYVNAADTAMQRHDVGVFYDHLAGDGQELQYGAWPVNVRPMAFHAKLMLLDYGDVVRAVISSANLTAAAWTRNLELFLVEDLQRGSTHAWAAGLATFVERLVDQIPEEHVQHRLALGTILDGVTPAVGSDRVTSSWDEPLLDALFAGVSKPQALDVVTPFFEGVDGEGVFDSVERRAPGIGGRLFVATTTDHGRPQVTGPPEKLGALIANGRWTMHGVRQTWDGDETGAPARGLHGKLLTLEHADGARTMVGSANVTRAALLGRARRDGSGGGSNVETVVLRDASLAAVRRLLPQADLLAADEVDICELPEGEAEGAITGPEALIRSATYFGKTAELEIVLTDDAPHLTFAYAGTELFADSTGAVRRAPLVLGMDCFVTVALEGATAIVPFTVVDAMALMPRGARRSITLDDFLDVLAGGRELPTRPADGERTANGPAGNIGDDFVGRTGPIPWRRYLAAVHGLSAELARERQYDRGLQFVLESPVRLKGLRDQLEAAHTRGRLTESDLAYALYELGRELERVRDDVTVSEGTQHISDACADLDSRRAAVTAALPDVVQQQLAILEGAERR